VNYKLLLPTYRTRFLFVQAALEKLGGQRPSRRMLHIGAGEGELDGFLSRRTGWLEACDVNERDVGYARLLNRELSNLRYSVEHAEKLGYPDASFDTVICLEVIEHVRDPHAVLSEVYRVLQPGGQAVFTFPSFHFPLVYDPLNRILRRLGRQLPIGAYAYGHRWLVREAEMCRWLAEHGFRFGEPEHLSRALIGLAECYLPGLLQRLFKANATNDATSRTKRFAIRPGTADPPLQWLVDALIALDRRLLPGSHRSVGLGFVAERPSA
jgi:ubiquinone/menaquinone biosynthesis C-methylase UbiE